MKPALVLGLALAANAMAADSENNELFVAPHGKLGDLKIMYDEIADDEFYKGNLPREAFKSDEEYRRYIVKRSAEEGDDEFLFRPLVPQISADDEELFVAPQGKLADLAKKYPGMIMFDEQADDELAIVLAPRSRFNSDEEYEKYKIRMRRHFDDVADDELHVPNKDILPKDGARRFIPPYFDKETRTWKIGAAQSAYFDDEELFANQKTKKPKKPAQEPTIAIGQADDELYFTDRGWKGLPNSGGKIFELFKSKFPPGYLTTPWAVKEADDELWVEAADDELGLKTVHLPAAQNIAYDDELAAMIAPRSRFNSDEEYKKYVYSMRNSRDDAADDELGLKIVHRPTAERLAYAFDDDELLAVRIPREKFPNEEAYRRYQVSLSEEAADDELLASNQPDEQNHTIRIPHWAMQRVDDEVTDDQLVTFDQHNRSKQTDQDDIVIIIHHWAMHSKDDEVTDDQLVTFDQNGRTNQPDNTRVIKIPSWNIQVKDDEVADEELAFRAPKVFFDRHLVKPAAKNHTSEAGHNLIKPAKDTTIEALVRDDEADDELNLLGQLLKDQIPQPFRRFDDDEFRAKGEKPSHVKIQEMGTEGPKIKRKLRPVVNEASFAQN